MSWNPVWEKIFSEKEWGKYPPEELVRFVASNYYAVAERNSVRFLELGCGPGSGPSWFIAREGFSYTGIDGAPTAITKAKQRFAREDLAGEFVLGDFHQLPWGEATFDCVFDIASLQHNSEKAADQVLNEVYRVLKTGGRHFSLISKSGCWGEGAGTKIDSTSYQNVSEGPFANMGVIRFATRESLERMYSNFKDLRFEYMVRTVNNCGREISNWVITCRK